MYNKMVKYECPRCDFKTDHRSNIMSHINRVNRCKCTKIDIDIKEYEESIINGTFNTIRKIIEEKNLLKKENEILHKENISLKTQLTSKKSNTFIGNNNIGSVVINIQLTPYNDPNLDNVEKYYKEAIKKAFMSVPTLIERIHFNEKMPENHNILMSNFRSKVLKVFNGKKWETIDEDKLIDELIDANERALEDWAEDDIEKMKYIKKYKEIKERDGEENVNNDLKTEVKKVLYDNRKMIKIKNL